MDKLIEANLTAVLRREGLEPQAGDLEQFSKIIELYVDNLTPAAFGESRFRRVGTGVSAGVEVDN